MTNKHNLPFVAAEDVTEPVRGVRGKSPASPPTGCTHRKGKNCTKEEEKIDSSPLQVFSRNRRDAFVKEWSEGK